ncbi:prolipoprotein diacylglyceryl transferase [uncultured Dysosmobacter sp.]|uniref:prolipoprotein diacylglyceryl transferase n=1 Tax=uncultured Dysosmobacter sp. TaxID=2591384 RepID=UPI00262C3FEA|nr:prolipoprotein diacylglyceryl transferase [uncultured Dysosmobacter sp.]
MTALKNMPISFPGLFGSWEFNPDPIAVHVGHGIYWYGIILACAMLAGLLLCMKQAPKYGLTQDNVLDLVLWAVPCCILGSRIYYVIFYLDLYRTVGGGLDWAGMLRIWDGGLAIYGTVIAGVLVAFFYTRHKKLRFGAMTDLAVMGLLLGQSIGRWANFINREAFGGLTDLPWRMRLWVSEVQYIEVHPTFFYESMWNLAGLLLILLVVSKGRRFDGENTWFYFLWYGLGRAWVEGLRTDSLYLFDWTLFGEPVRVSQALSVVMAAVAAFMLFYNIRVKKRTADGLLVNQLAARAAAEAGETARAADTEPAAGEMAAEDETDAETAAGEAAETAENEAPAQAAKEKEALDGRTD